MDEIITIRSFWVLNRVTQKCYYAKRIKRDINYKDLEIIRLELTKRMNNKYKQDCIIHVFYTQKGFNLK